jgi:hypothetical protein
MFAAAIGAEQPVAPTAAGDYLIGFDVRSASETELQTLLESMRSVRFD